VISLGHQMARSTTTWMRTAEREKGRAGVWCAAKQLTKLLGCRVYRPCLPLWHEGIP